MPGHGKGPDIFVEQIREWGEEGGRRGRGKERKRRKDTEPLPVLPLPLNITAPKPGCSEREEGGD